VLKSIVIVLVFLLPSFVRAQAPTEAESESDLADKSVCLKSGDAVRVAPNAKQVKEPKPKTLGDKVVNWMKLRHLPKSSVFPAQSLATEIFCAELATVLKEMPKRL
jgi:hypothetical protein